MSDGLTREEDLKKLKYDLWGGYLAKVYVDRFNNKIQFSCSDFNHELWQHVKRYYKYYYDEDFNKFLNSPSKDLVENYCDVNLTKFLKDKISYDEFFNRIQVFLEKDLKRFEERINDVYSEFLGEKND